MKRIPESFEVIWTEYASQQLIDIYNFIKGKTSYELAK